MSEYIDLQVCRIFHVKDISMQIIQRNVIRVISNNYWTLPRTFSQQIFSNATVNV